MAFNPFTVIKSLLIKKEGVLTPDSVEIIPGGSDTGVKVTIEAANSVDVNLTLPNEGGVILTDSGTATVTSKTIDADDNTISNLENDNIKVGAAIDAAKIHDGTVSNTEFGYLDGVTSPIQTQLTNNATAISDHIADAVGAHAASAISNTPSGNLVATDVQGALNEIQTELDAVVIVANDAATRELDNLTTTALNTDLLPDADGTRDLGSATLEFAETHTKSLNRTTSGNLSVNVVAGDLVLNPSGDIDANNKPIINVPNPVAALDAANKEYVDSLSAGLDPKAAVRVASTTDIGGSYATTPSNGRFTGAATTIDGETLVSGDRVLLKDQTDAQQNGIYVYDGSGQYTRSPDMDGSPASEVSAGNFTFSTQGTLNSAAGFVLIGTGLITLNVDDVVFTPFSGGSGGASRFLDNLLSPVAINQDLLPGTNNSRDIGSSSLKFKDVYTQGNVVVDGTLTSSTGQNLDIATPNAALNDASSTVSIATGTTSGLGVSGQVQITTGTSASQSGNITIQTGTGAGTRGDVTISARATQLTAGALNIQQGQTAVANTSQQSLTIPSTGVSEGLVQLTASDSSVRNVLAVSSTGLAQAPNLIINGDAEGKLTSSTSIFTPYADAAGTSPVDGIGGSPNVTTTVTATTPLSGSKSYLLTKDAVNRQGQGWSILDVNVPLAMRGRVLSIKFDYMVSSGTFNAGTNTTDSDVTIWIYDIGNLRLIQPSSYKLLSNSTTIVDQFQAEFQTPIDMASFRLIAHIGSTNASAYTLELDNIVVSPSEYVFGSPVSDWQSYTPTFTNFGAVTNAKGFHRRVGDKMELRFSVTTGTTAAALASMSLPPGYSIDANKLNITNNTTAASGDFVGITTTSQSATNLRGSVLTAPGTSTTLLYFSQQDGASTNKLIPANGNTVAAPSIIFMGELSVPIAGQSSSVQMADQTSTRVVAFCAPTSAATITGTQQLTITTPDVDTHAGLSSNNYTIPVAGVYEISNTISGNFGGASNISASIYLNAAPIKTMITGSTAASQNLNTKATITRTFRTGDVIAFYGIASAGTFNISANTCEIKRISGPSQIASVERIAASYSLSTNQTSNATTPIPFDVRQYDTHNACTVGTGFRFTAPNAGIYTVSGLFTTNNTTLFVVYKNGTAYGPIGRNAATFEYTTTLDVPLNAGEFLDVRFATSQTAIGAAFGSNNACVINIKRLGGTL